MCRLRSYEVNPPGGYLYVQTQGVKRNFPAEPLIEAQAKIVSAFRAGNNLPRANVRQCIEDIDRFNAQRLGCNRQWTVPINSTGETKTISLANTHPLVSASGGGCKGCGATVFVMPAA